jgi:ParB family chromosome partitioning protein
LGKGLDALFADNSADSSATLPIHEIEPNKDQPRKHFSEEALAELADSIRTHGVLQPLLVRPLPNGRYQLIAGERRWRASRMAGLTELPVVIREMTDAEAMQLALIENLQREDLNPVEEAMGYRQLMDSCGMTQERVAAAVGKSRPAIANALRLLNLPQPVLSMVQDGELTAGHAKALLSLEEENLMLENAMKIRADKITVRQIEQLARRRKAEGSAERPPKAPSPSPAQRYLAEVGLALTEELGRKVNLRGSEKGGTLTLEFFDEEDLRELAFKLTGQRPAWDREKEEAARGD